MLYSPIKRAIIPFLFAATLIFAALAVAQAPEAKISTEDELKVDVQAGPCKNDDRLEAVKTLFKKMGAADDAITIDKFKDIQNVVVTKKGKTDEIVVVGAHYDKVSDGCGTIDNWTGIVILAHMYRTLSAMSTQKTYLFVAFDKEETGLRGTAAMVKAIPKEKRASYCSMVNLDSFGLGYPLVLENATSPKMLRVAKDLGKELKVAVNSVSLAGMADADSSSFKEKDIPAITLSGLSAKFPEYLHKSKDKFENVLMGSVRVGYQYGLQYLAKVDSEGCTAYK